MLGFTEEDYLKSIGPESILGNLLLGNLHTMTELVSEGKSGSLFYLTHDSQFFVKTVREDEFHSAVGMIKSYYDHLYRNTNSLLVKTVNIYKLEVFLGRRLRNLYVLVMKNLFAEIKKPDLVFDLKGSTHGRKSKIPKGK